MTFQFVRASISKECRDNIKLLFREKRIRGVDVAGLMADIEQSLRNVYEYQIRYVKKPLAAAKIKHEARVLSNAILALHDGTKDVMRDFYYAWNAAPVVGADTSLHRIHQNFLVQVEKKTMVVSAVVIDDLIARLLMTCKIVEAIGGPGKGAPRDRVRLMVTEELIVCYERWTKKKATSVPKGAFETFVSYILEEVEGAESGMSRRKLIETALKMRRDREAERRELGPEAVQRQEEAIERLARNIALRFRSDLCS